MTIVNVVEQINNDVQEIKSWIYGSSVDNEFCFTEAQAYDQASRYFLKQLKNRLPDYVERKGGEYLAEGKMQIGDYTIEIITSNPKKKHEKFSFMTLDDRSNMRDKVLKAVCSYFNIKKEGLFNNSSTKNKEYYILARRIAIYLFSKKARLKMSEIAEFMNYSEYSVVSYNFREAQKQISNPDTDESKIHTEICKMI